MKLATSIVLILLLVGASSFHYGASIPGVRAPAIPPSSPKNLTGDGSGGYVILRWKPAAAPDEHPVAKYNIYKGESEGNETYYDSVDASVTEYEDRNVEVGKTYWYYVTAVNDVGESNRSNEVNVTVQKGTNAPTPPKNLRAKWNQTVVILTWDLPTYDGGAPIVFYNVYRNHILLGNTTLQTFKDTDIDIHKNYTYYVTAVNGAGKESNPSMSVEVSWSKPGAPQNLKVEREGNYIILSWKPGLTGNLEIEEYRIYMKDNGIWKLLGNTTETTYKIPLSSLPTGKVEIMVTAVNALGEGDGATVEVTLGSSNILPYIALGAGALAIVLIAIYILRRRKVGS